jgi:tetratricopeptide (TPR) repeat protein
MRGEALATLLLTVASSGALAGTGPPIRPGPSSLRDCDQAVRARPKTHAAYSCYFRLAHEGHQGRAPVLKHLQSRRRLAADDPFLQLWVGILAHDGGQTAVAEPLLRRAADTFRALADPQGEVLARAELAVLLCYLPSEAEAQRQLDQLSSLAERTGDPELRANALQAAGLCARKAHDHGKAIALNTQALQLLDSAPPSFWTDRVKALVLDGLGTSYSDSGRHREAYDMFLSQSELVASDPFALAIVRHRLASQSVNLADRGDLRWDEADLRIRESLEMEHTLGAPHWPPYATRILAAARRGPSAEAIQLLDEALAFWRPLRGGAWGVLTALRLRGKFRADLAPGDPGPALADVDEALAMAHGTSTNHWNAGMALLVRSHVHRRCGNPGRANQDALAALDELDRLRDLQVDQLIRAWLGSETDFAYQLVAGWMLDPARGGGSGDSTEQAFATIERNRARALLEALVSARVDLRPPPGPLAERQREVLALLASTQRRLLAPGLPPDSRARALEDLTRLEREEEAIRDQLVRQGPRVNTLDRTVPTLGEVQQALDPDQAMLSFQTWRRQHDQDSTFDDGSSWVLAITREAVRAWRIPDADQLEQRIRFLLGVIERRDGTEGPGAATLQHDVLASALGSLPRGVSRLVIIPDGPLHLLPFQALRDEHGHFLGSRYEISVAPSAALWLRWTGQRVRSLPASSKGLALVMASSSSALATVALGPSERAGASWIHGLQLQALPFAGEEAAAITAALEGRTQVMRDAAASERFLKSADLGGVRILHLAAHAVVDEDKPERSAVVLEPGSAEEDGLLQLGEIANLELAGKLVVLAACRSSGGMVLRGEGPVSLARAFFQGGAPTVVGSLWELRDDESAALMKDFYRALGKGRSTASALALAQREAIKRGAPAAAWAGMVVLGDGDLLPMPPQRGWPVWAWVLLAMGAVAGGGVALRVLGRGRPG